jgi:hypothetical protein
MQAEGVNFLVHPSRAMGMGDVAALAGERTRQQVSWDRDSENENSFGNSSSLVAPSEINILHRSRVTQVYQGKARTAADSRGGGVKYGKTFPFAVP